MKDMTTTQSLDVFLTALQGQNFSPKTLRAYGDDLCQFLGFVAKNRVDWDSPTRFSRVDIEAFMSYLAGQHMTGITWVRKLASIRKFFTFLEENQIIAGNPANTVRGARREEKEPGILYKEQYKALLYEASDHPRDYAILMTFLQTGIRLSELTNLRVEDVDLEHRVLTVRQGKGKRDRQIPLVDEAVKALRNYARYRNTDHRSRISWPSTSKKPAFARRSASTRCGIRLGLIRPISRRISQMLKPSPSENMEEWRVGDEARNPKNDDPEVMKPTRSEDRV